MLSGLRPASLARLRFPLAELTKPEVRELAAARRAAGRRRRPRARTSAFSPARASAPFSLATAGSASARARSSTATGRAARPPPRPPRVHRRPAPRARDRLARAALRARHRRRVEHGRRRPARRARDRPRFGCARRPCTGRGGRVDRVRLRYHARPLACAARPRFAAGEHAELELELAEPAYGVAPGQTACLMSGDVVVGRATIA